MEQWVEFTVRTTGRVEFREITAELNASLQDSGLKDGFGIVFIPHTTAGLTINENADPDVVRDMIMAFAHIVPEDLPFRHGEGNSPAHLKASLVGFERILPVQNGRLALGTWQGVYLCEFYGPRLRKVRVRWQGQ